MEWNDAKVYFQDNLDVFLQDVFLVDTRRNFSCIFPDHEDSEPSMSYFVGDDGIPRVKCFGCKRGGDIFDIIKEYYGINDFPEQMKKAAEYFNVDLDDLKSIKVPEKRKHEKKEPPKPVPDEFISSVQKRIGGTSYLINRGISKETLEHFGVGYLPAWKHPDIPTDESVETVFFPNDNHGLTARRADGHDEKQRIRKYGPSGFFNSSVLFDQTDPVYVVEGETDAMSLYEIGKPAVALTSINLSESFIKMLKARKDDIKARALILAPDSDKRGQECVNELVNGLIDSGIPFYAVNIARGHHDANQFLQENRDELKEICETESADPDRKVREYKAEYKKSAKNEQAERVEESLSPEYYEDALASKHLDGFLERIMKSDKNPPAPTGFDELDKELDGGLFEGLYCLGSISSFGKTTMAMQMMDYIASSGEEVYVPGRESEVITPGRNVMIFSLEMSRDELIGRSLSRLTFTENLKSGGDAKDPKTYRYISDGRKWKNYSESELDLIERATDVYRAYSEKIHIFEGVGDIGVDKIKKTVEGYIDSYGIRPVVLIDYLQILEPVNERGSDKQNTDKAVLELKRMSRDCKIPVFVISSFNRENYQTKVTMSSFKESGRLCRAA